jgi:hypothetical protein
MPGISDFRTLGGNLRSAGGNDAVPLTPGVELPAIGQKDLLIWFVEAV